MDIAFVPYIFLFFLLIIVLSFIAYLFYIRHVRSKYSHLPSPPLDNWLTGHLPSIKRKRQDGQIFHQILYDWSLKYGNLFVIWFMHIPYIIAVGSDLAKKVIVTLNLPKAEKSYVMLQNVCNTRLMGKGLVTQCNTHAWLRKRIVLNPAFHRKYLMDFIAKFNSSCDKLIGKLGEYADTNVAVDLAEEFHRVTMDIIAKVGFNMDLNAIDDKDCPFLIANYLVLKGVHESLKDMLWKINIWTYPFQWKVIKAAKFVRDSGRKIIEERIAAIKDGKTTPNDILQHIIEMKANNPSVTMDEMVDEFVTFFLAGQETTSNLLSFTLYEIEKQVEIKHRLIQEVINVLDGKTYVSHDDLSKLEYLKWTLKEGLRLHPPVQGFPRVNHKEIELAGYKIPAGSSIELSIYSEHICESNWTNPTEFNPGRFANSSSIPIEKYFPFSMGPRSCIGKTFAQIESKILIARLYQEFDFELVSDEPLRYEEAVTIRPIDGVWCKVKRRH